MLISTKDVKYSQNVMLLPLLMFSRALSISSAYLMPFFASNGIGIAGMLSLHAFFSFCLLAMEFGGGYIADRFGRVRAYRFGMIIVGVVHMLYPLAGIYWQFMLIEFGLAVGFSLMTGVDEALLVDSLKALGRNKDYISSGQRIDRYLYWSQVLSLPFSLALVYFVGVGATLAADGVMVLLGALLSLKLYEVPHRKGQEEEPPGLLMAARQLGRDVRARWLIALMVTMNVTCFLSYWMMTPYFEMLGIAPIWFGAIFAVKCLFRILLLHRYKDQKWSRRNMLIYIAMAALAYAVMASGSWWLLVLFLSQDVMVALQKRPIADRVKEYIVSEFRATVNSAINMLQRLIFITGSLVTGLLISQYGLSACLMIIGTFCVSVALISVWRLSHYGTFLERS